MTVTAPDNVRAHDVVIVGGGLVGASLAIALDQAGVETALVEAAPLQAMPPVFDQRNLSFADATVNALSALGVLDKLRAPAGRIRRIHVSRRGDFGRTLLQAADYDRREFGQVVVARDFGDALEARLGELRHCTRYRPARFIASPSLASDARDIVLSTDDGERTLRARLLVAADGTHSGVRTALGIGARTHDYGQTLLVARVRSQRPPDGTAYERFGDDGPTALLPRGDGHYGAIVSVAGAQAQAAAAEDDAAFLARLQDAFGWRAGRFVACGERGAYPAVRVLADALVAERAVLVGNAAQTLHPNGAQGFNLGLRDALTLAELLARDGIAALDGDLLDAYARRRARDRDDTIAFSHTLATTTADGRPLPAALRTAGFLLADRLPSLQGWLVGGAMGSRGDVPALCRPRT